MIKKIMKKNVFLLLTILVSIFFIINCMNTATAATLDEGEKKLKRETQPTPETTTTQNTPKTERSTTPDTKETTQTITTGKGTTPNLEKEKTPDTQDSLTENNNLQDETEKLKRDKKTLTGTKPDSLIQNELKTKFVNKITQSFEYAYLEYSLMNTEKKEAYRKCIIENAKSMGLKADSVIKQIKETGSDVKSLMFDGNNLAFKVALSETNELVQTSKAPQLLQWITNGMILLGLDASYI